MRRIGLIAAVVMTVMAASVAGSANAISTASVRATSSGVTTWWVDSTWVSPLTGWVLGEGSAGCPSCIVIKHTEDGGRTWSTVSVPSEAVFASNSQICPSTESTADRDGVSHLRFVNRLDGYLFGPSLFTTFDGGRTWHRQPGGATVALEVVEPHKVVWRVACESALRTSLLAQQAGSARWVRVAPFTGFLWSMQLVATGSPLVLLAVYGHIAGGVTSHAYFDITANQGRSWSTRTDPCGHTGRFENDAFDTSATGASVVVECVPKVSGTGFVLESRNGGSTFGPRRPIPSGFGTMVAAANTSTIVLASGNVFGGGPFTYMVWTSTNGGVTWRTVVRDPETLTGSTPGQSYLAFVTPTVAHWIGFGNKLWTTTDAGLHWTASNV